MAGCRDHAAKAWSLWWKIVGGNAFKRLCTRNPYAVVPIEGCNGSFVHPPKKGENIVSVAERRLQCPEPGAMHGSYWTPLGVVNAASTWYNRDKYLVIRRYSYISL